MVSLRYRTAIPAGPGAVENTNPSGIETFVTESTLNTNPSSTSSIATSYAVAKPLLVATSVTVISSPASPRSGEIVLEIAICGSIKVTGGPITTAGGFGLPAKVTLALLVITFCGTKPALAGKSNTTASKRNRKIWLEVFVVADNTESPSQTTTTFWPLAPSNPTLGVMLVTGANVPATSLVITTNDPTTYAMPVGMKSLICKSVIVPSGNPTEISYVAISPICKFDPAESAGPVSLVATRILFGEKSEEINVARLVSPVNRCTSHMLVESSESPLAMARFVTVVLGGNEPAVFTSNVKTSDSPTSMVFVPVGAFVSDSIRSTSPATS